MYIYIYVYIYTYMYTHKQNKIIKTNKTKILIVNYEFIKSK